MTTATVYWHRATCCRCARRMKVSAAQRDQRKEYITYCPRCKRDTVHTLTALGVEARA